MSEECLCVSSCTKLKVTSVAGYGRSLISCLTGRSQYDTQHLSFPYLAMTL